MAGSESCRRAEEGEHEAQCSEVILCSTLTLQLKPRLKLAHVVERELDSGGSVSHSLRAERR
jgi:hypothetical protein